MSEDEVIEIVREKDHSGRIVWGVLLIGFGLVYLGSYLGVIPWLEWGTWWPLLVITLSVARLFTSRTPERLGGSVTGVLMGCWFLLAVNNWHGLGWARSWPLALVAIGVGWVARGIAAPLMRGDERGRIDVSL